MSLVSIFLFTVLILAIIFVMLLKILDTSAARIFLLTIKDKIEQREKEKEIAEFKKTYIEDLKYKDELLETILKMKKGEEVKIPLAAWNYIYQNIDDYILFDKKGNLTIVNQEDYFKFREKAKELLEDTKKHDIDITRIIKEQKSKKVDEPIQITEYPDGTFTKKDNTTGIIEIVSPSGEKILVDTNKDDMIIERDKKEEEKSKKEYAMQKQEEERKAKELEQKFKINAAKVKELEEKNAELERIIKEATSGRNSIKNTNNNNTDIENNIRDKNEEKNSSPKNFLQRNKTINPEKKEINHNIKQNKEENNNNDNIRQNNNINKNIRQATNLQLSYADSSNISSFLSHFRHTQLLDYLLFIVLNDNKLYTKCVLNDVENATILINVNWFAYKLYSLLDNEQSRETFLKMFFSSIEKNNINNDFLTKIINKINDSFSLKYGRKIIYQEKKDNDLVVNFKSIKFKDQEDVLWQGVYLVLFSKNKFGDILKDKGIFDTIVEINIINNKKKGKIVYFSDLVTLHVE